MMLLSRTLNFELWEWEGTLIGWCKESFANLRPPFIWFFNLDLIDFSAGKKNGFGLGRVWSLMN